MKPCRSGGWRMGADPVDGRMGATERAAPWTVAMEVVHSTAAPLEVGKQAIVAAAAAAAAAVNVSGTD